MVKRQDVVKSKDLSFTVLVEEHLQLVVSHFVTKVLDVDIGEFFGFGPQFGFPLLAGLKTTYEPKDKERERERERQREREGDTAETHSRKMVPNERGNLGAKSFVFPI